MRYELSGFDGKLAVVTGAGRMRSIGRPIALALLSAAVLVPTISTLVPRFRRAVAVAKATAE